MDGCEHKCLFVWMLVLERGSAALEGQTSLILGRRLVPSCVRRMDASSGVTRGGIWGVQTPPPGGNSEGPPKSFQTQPDCENC